MLPKMYVKRTTLLNVLIENFGYRTYLEIGVNDPSKNFDLVNCKAKTGVDPQSLRSDILAYTSDQYFRGLKSEVRFDLIFIDGLHHCDQVLKDIHNALAHLNPGGYIVCHDMLPDDEPMQTVPRKVVSWTGDCWKAWAHLRMTRTDLAMFVVNTDHGLGLIQPGRQKLFKEKKDILAMDFDFFETHKQKLMNIFEIEALFPDLQDFPDI